MSLLTNYGIRDLERITVDLMNTMYDKEWTTDVTDYNDEFLFKRIEILHERIITDLKVNSVSQQASSELFTIANRLATIDNALFGSSEHLPDAISIKWCIEYTSTIINNLCIHQRSYCVVQ